MFSTNRSRMFSEAFFQEKKGQAAAFVALALVVLFVGPANVLAVDYQVQDAGGVQVEQEAVDVNEEPGAQVNEEAQELMDFELPEELLTFFDPDSIPDSVPLPQTTWVFQVPVEVSDLPAEVEKIGVYCNVYFTFRGEGWGSDPFPLSCGEAKKKIDVVNGSVSQVVTIGVEGRWVESASNPAWKADKWECKMYLIGPDHSWKIPSTDVVHPAWRRADPGEPFRWHAGPHPLPEEARVADPEG